MNFLRIALLFFVLGSCVQSKAATDSLSVYPNPFQDSATIEVYVAADAQVSLLVFNIWGDTAKLFLNDVFLTAGSYSYMLYADELYPDMFTVYFRVDSHALIQNIFVFNTVGIAETTEGDGITVFSNPAVNNQWHLQVDEKWVGSHAELFDVNGQLVYSTVINNTNQTIPADVPKGMYVLKVMGVDVVTVRLVK